MSGMEPLPIDDQRPTSRGQDDATPPDPPTPPIPSKEHNPAPDSPQDASWVCGCGHTLAEHTKAAPDGGRHCQPCDCTIWPGENGDGFPVDQYLTRAHRRTYTNAERMGYVMLAVMDGDSETCRRYGLPRGTLQNWLRDAGGITLVREFLSARAYHGFLEAERSLYASVKRQADADKVPMVELYQTMRALINARALPSASAQAQPTAAAQANVTVTIGDKDGQRVIDLGPPPEETE